ncbi:MAG TPA: transposase [Bacteroidota bacterium]|nr:transposase [Bacteroidota bacterium]
MVKSRPHYNKEFKLRVCRELASGATVAEVSRRHQLHPSLLYHWAKQYRQNPAAPFPSSGGQKVPQESSDPSAERIAELERLVGRLTLEIEFLKKTLRGVESTFGRVPPDDGTH